MKKMIALTTDIPVENTKLVSRSFPPPIHGSRSEGLVHETIKVPHITNVLTLMPPLENLFGPKESVFFFRKFTKGGK